MVVIDFTLLESNSKGYEYVVVIIDVFTKYTVADPTIDKKTTRVAKAIAEKLVYIPYHI